MLRAVTDPSTDRDRTGGATPASTGDRERTTMRAWLALFALSLPMVALSVDMNGVGVLLPVIGTIVYWAVRKPSDKEIQEAQAASRDRPPIS